MVMRAAVANAVSSFCRNLPNMQDDMSNKYRIFQRASGVWYLEDKATHHQESLRTRIADEAKRILQAKNEAHRMPGVNLQIARAYVVA